MVTQNKYWILKVDEVRSKYVAYKAGLGDMYELFHLTKKMYATRFTRKDYAVLVADAVKKLLGREVVVEEVRK